MRETRKPIDKREKRDKSFLGTGRKKCVVRPGNCKISGLTTYFIGCRPGNVLAGRENDQNISENGSHGVFYRL